MRRIVVFTVLVGLLSGFHYFSKTYGKNDEGEVLKKMILVEDGYIVAGNGYLKGWILKIDSTGGVVWYRYLSGLSLNGMIRGGDAGFAGVASPNQDTIVFFKLNPSGNVTSSRYFTDSNGQLKFMNIHIDRCSTDRYYISGPAYKSLNFQTYFYYFVILIDSSGNPIRSKVFYIGSNSSSYGEFASHHIGTDLLISMTNYDLIGVNVVQIDSQLNIVWSKRFYNNDQTPYWFIPEDIGEFEEGFVIAGQRSYNRGDIALVAIDSSGAPLWFGVYKTDYTNGNDKAIDVSNSISGGIVVAANGKDYSTNIEDLIYLKIDVNGNLEWSKQFRDPGGHNVTAGAIRETGDGPYLVGGTFNSGVNADYLIFTVTLSGDYPGSCPYITGITISDSLKQGLSEDVSVTPEPFSVQDGDYQVGNLPFEIISLCGEATMINEKTCDCGQTSGRVVLRSLKLQENQMYKVYSTNGRLIYSGRGRTLKLPVGVYFVRKSNGGTIRILILK